ncbi:hypothetical protein X975_15306, partial [Stegodyphus mimosarum]
MNQFAILRLWQRFQRTGDVTRRPVSGRPRVTTSRQDRYLVISARRQRGNTARALGSALTIATGIRISKRLRISQKRARLNWLFETSALECGRVGQCDVH